MGLVNTVYGLEASVWTSNLHRPLRATREINSGCVWVKDPAAIV
ncbi:aldehyde dehydrogenase family protein [Arthrobacter sp. HLT1-20]